MADEVGEVSEVAIKAEPERNKGGRPPALIADHATLRQIRGLGKLQCTVKEAAAFLGVVENTFSAFLNAHPDAKEAFEAGRGVMKVSLRRAQFRAALRGNATMLIFLGKNLLGQKDQNDLAVSGGLDLSGAKARLDGKLAPALGIAAAGRSQDDPARFDA